MAGLLNALLLGVLVIIFNKPIHTVIEQAPKKLSKKRKGYIFEPNEDFDNLMEKLEKK